MSGYPVTPSTFDELDAWFQSLPSTTALDLKSNKLTALPESIGALVGLKELKLHSNQLTALSESIVALTALTTLSLHNNPLTKPQSPAFEAWLATLKDGGCDVYR